MALYTAPLMETEQVVSGINYQLTISEADGGTGITRIEFGPYRFPLRNGLVKYPEAPTNELCPSGWQQVGWVTGRDGASWLRFEGGVLYPEDGYKVFQFTSNFPPVTGGVHKMNVWRGTRIESFDVPVPDYSQPPPARNPRRDSTGLGAVYKQWGLFPKL
jgi:hypothetical protein